MTAERDGRPIEREAPPRRGPDHSAAPDPAAAEVAPSAPTCACPSDRKYCDSPRCPRDPRRWS
jgi:hypothetical protein